MKRLGVLIAFAVLFLPACAVAQATSETAPSDIRVGIVVFRDAPLDIERCDRLFGELPGFSKRFRLAIGTPADVASWMDRDVIDLALVDRRTFLSVSERARRDDAEQWDYLGSEISPGDGTTASGLIALGSPKLAERQRLRDALLGMRPERFRLDPDSVSPRRLSERSSGRLSQALSLDLVGSMLVQHRCVEDRPLRLAVVFSGGGAKCSYQAGAIRALEEKLAALRTEYNDPAFDISLVVGTSGGALNVVPVATGMTQTNDGMVGLESAWRELDQRDLIRPSLPVRANMVLWFVCVQGVILLRLRRERHFKNPEKYPWIISRSVIAIGVIEVLIARAPVKPWSLLGESSLLHHLWLWLTWGLEGSGWTLISIGVISAFLRKAEKIHSAPFLLRYRYVRRAFWVGIFLLPAIQFVNICFYQPTLSNSVGIERVLTRSFGTMVNDELVRRGKDPIPLEEISGQPGGLRTFSEEFLKRGIFKRDLVLTGSALPRTTTESPADLYFYLPASGSSPRPHFGARGIELEKRPALFLDALLASGAIYPVFPSRTLFDVPRTGEVAEVVDGSFEHRSPIEAAVLWGATHIVLLQAATDEVVERGAFLENLNAAMNHLYDQAQLLDFRSRENVETFTLTPRPPHIGLLDFADNLISKSIAKGYREARGEGEGDVPALTWKKEIGEPRFWVPGSGGGPSYCSGRSC